MGSTIAHSASVRSLGYRRPLRSAARRCSGVHIGRSSKENQAPDKESHPIYQTQELPGSALRPAAWERRRESAVLLQNPNAFGDALTTDIAGNRSDKTGP